ncbi:hypothetical protein SAMN04488137_4771 [Fictibacillus solisalsi]|uniref:Uncharacterized protein n=1 Tax=Fictibacillus solisalsi TaxID=459525 RepID=A0A1H0C397_9BACL|nr:hypothetical protein SAMN04488137_4771 [Fictibacillus solisalsi]
MDKSKTMQKAPHQMGAGLFTSNKTCNLHRIVTVYHMIWKWQ